MEGYEIHMGESTVRTGCTESALPALLLEDRTSGRIKEDGLCRGNVLGTYVHGLFDSKETAQALIGLLAARKGLDLSDIHGMDYAAFKETQYDLLAASLRKHLDLEAVYGLLGIGRMQV